MGRVAVSPVAVCRAACYCHSISLVKVHCAQEDNVGSVSACPALTVIVVGIGVGTRPPGREGRKGEERGEREGKKRGGN